VNYIRKQFPEGEISGLSFAAHGIGTASQEPPFFVPEEAVTAAEGFKFVEPGMTLSVAAGVYDHVHIGCRIEEVIEITEVGNRVLSRSPFYGFDALYSGG
jgi:Xaa-Pro aminopeptidase